MARIFTVVSTKMYINKNTSFAVASALYDFVAFFLPPPSLPHQTKREVSRFSALLTSTQISMTTQGQRQVLLTGPYKCQSYCQRFLSDCLTHVLPIPVHTVCQLVIYVLGGVECADVLKLQVRLFIHHNYYNVLRYVCMYVCMYVLGGGVGR